jgi:tRNA 2-selenouridine synthase
MSSFIRQARKLSVSGNACVYCWRGGMRSESMAWLFQLVGLKPSVLKGGYKFYRRFIHELFGTNFQIGILGGMTGSGKTDVLLALKEKGQQVIDLEGLANHKGSVFGGLGQAPQPSTEHFENLLAHELLKIDLSRLFWLEDESLNVGHVAIPAALYDLMQSSPMVMMDVPPDVRTERLVAEYGNFDREVLQSLVTKISRRLGAVQAKKAIEALDQGNLKISISIVLNYYDKAYQHKIEIRNDKSIVSITADPCDPHANAELIIDKARKIGLI